MWEIINSSVGLLLIGFICTGVLGAFLNSQIQSRAWERQRKHDLLVRSLSDGRVLFDEITVLLNRRVFGLLKVLWAIEDGKSREEVLVEWADYYPTVREWNEKLQSFRFKIEALAGQEVADRLLDYGDVASSDTPNSIHYQMRRAHSLVLELRESIDEEQGSRVHKLAKRQMNQLQGEAEAFLRTIAQNLLYTERTLKEQL